jgi:lipoic acid synthetase
MELPVLNNLPAYRRATRPRLPEWLRKRLPAGGEMMQTRRLIDGLGLATVCTDARCPNQPECWSRRTAVFMILGRHCTRHCHYCAVEPGVPEPVADDEPTRVAEAAAALGLRHVVITSVTRDDLPDEGAEHFRRCVAAVKERSPDAMVEVLTPDFHARAECIERVLSAGPAIFNHNIETVRRLTPVLRPQGDYQRSLAVLHAASKAGPSGLRVVNPQSVFIKSGLIIGLGETFAEIEQTLADLRAAGCQIVTVGQYLAPTDRSAPVVKFYRPEEFDAIARLARDMGFLSVASGPFVRSSYNAEEVYQNAIGSTAGRAE